MEERIYRVVRIDGDYAHLERLDAHEDDLLLVARALLPPETGEGTKLRWVFLQYELME